TPPRRRSSDSPTRSRTAAADWRAGRCRCDSAETLRCSQVASASNGGGVARVKAVRVMGVRAGATGSVVTDVGTAGALSKAGSSNSASRMMRRGSYWRGSSLRQSTSSTSGPSSSFILLLVSRRYSPARRVNLLKASAALGSRSGPMMSTATMPISSSLSMSRPQFIPPGYPSRLRSGCTRGAYPVSDPSHRRRTMSEHDANARFARETIVEPAAISRARTHALELGASPLSPAVGAQLAVLAAASGARSMVEIGTGAGVSGLWLLRGAPQAVLTTIDNEPEHLAAARQAFADARIPPAKSRFITGRAADVLPRMNESSYDIVLVDADPE